MKLQRLRIEQLRQFRQPFEISSFEPGINLFTGPNESGKSTLVRAIRAAFFERYKSGSLDDLQPWGDSSASPGIELDFDWEDARWQLTKNFVKQKRCDLKIAHQNFSGEDADEKLAELLGYQYSGRGASRAENWGIPGLLWIEQGSGQEIHDAVSNASDHLKLALGSSLGEVASSAGDSLTTQVEQERGLLLTGTGRYTGDYARIIQQHEECSARLDELNTSISTYRLQVDRLGELRLQQKADATNPWTTYRTQAIEAETQLAEVESWVSQQQRESKELQHCQSSQKLCRDQLQGFAEQKEDLVQRDKAKQKAATAFAELQAGQAQITDRLMTARTTHLKTRETLKHARQAERLSALIRESKQLERDLATLQESLSQAKALQTKLTEQRAQLQAAEINSTQLKRLKKLDREQADQHIALQAIATRLRFELLPGMRLQLGDEALAGEGERLLLEPHDLHIEGIGTLQIHPGGEDIGELSRRQLSLQDDITNLLSSLKITSLAEAEIRQEQCRILQNEIQQSELMLSRHAPDGIEDLISQKALVQSRQKDLQKQLAELPEELASELNAAAAEMLEDSAADQLKLAEQAEANFRAELALAEQRLQSANLEWQRLEQELNAPGRQLRMQELNTQLIDLQATAAGLESSLTIRQQQIDAANPDILRQDILRLTRTADGLEKASHEREKELLRLQISLETLGAQGLEEQHAELTQELQFIGRRRDELARRAAALDLLLNALRAKRQALTRRLQAPLQKHINRYLQLLFPQASLSVNENLIPDQLTRSANGKEEHGDFEELSFGAREQMSLISRLAYADLLQEAGRPTLIILDDALVHSDQQRLGQMKRILFDASQRHQILLFSCHPENWQDMGVVARELQALKSTC